MEKLIAIFTKVMKIWNFKLTREDIAKAVDEGFAKYDKDKSGTLELKDLIMEIWEIYKAKKG